MEYFVYILQSQKTGEFYKGLTDNFSRRFHEHVLGKCKFTRDKLPIDVIYVHVCKDRIEARDWEKFFKSGIGREVIKELAGMVKWYTRTL